MHKAALTILAITALLFSSGCGNRMWEDGKRVTRDTYNYVFDDAPTAVSFHDDAEIPLIEVNHNAADILGEHVDGEELSTLSPVYVSRFVDQADPESRAIFGTVVARQVADRLVQQEMRITEGEPLGTDYIYVGDTTSEDYLGMTDRKVDELPPRAAQLTGDYVVGDDYVYVSAKITRLVDHTEIAAHSWTVPVTDNVRELLPRLKRPGEGMTPTVATKFK